MIMNPSSSAIFYLIVNGWYLGQLGDYSSCEVFTLNGSYMLADIAGDYSDIDYTFTRGTLGKYFDFRTQMGLCVPRQCTTDEIYDVFAPLLTQFAENALWKEPTVTINPSMKYNEETAAHMTTGRMVAFSIIAILFLLVLVATVIELTSIGDDPDFDKQVLSQLSKFKSST
jgi:hypothetical protein